MRYVHLYVVKLFGCMIVEGGVTQIDIGPFASSILNDRIHPNVYVAFGSAPQGKIEDKVNHHIHKPRLLVDVSHENL